MSCIKFRSQSVCVCVCVFMRVCLAEGLGTLTYVEEP